MLQLVRNGALLLPLLISVLSSTTARAGDVLLDQMQGKWTGVGEKIESISGRHIRIDAQVTAVMQGDKLLSHNEITETDPTGSARTYVRDYWVRASLSQSGSQPGLYEFGVQDQVTTQGHYQDGVLEVLEELGGGSGYVIRSLTRFDANGSVHQESLWYGNRELSQTQIRYHR